MELKTDRLGLLLADLWLPPRARRKLGYAAAIGLGIILCFSLLAVHVGTDTVQYAFGKMFALDPLALFFKRFFLAAALILPLLFWFERLTCGHWLDREMNSSDDNDAAALARIPVAGITEIVLLERNQGAWMPRSVGDMPLETIARADAWLAVPAASEGFAAGTPVDAYMLRE